MSMTKKQILEEIKRTAAANGGVPLGWRKFATETGIRDPDWKGKLWARWNDALREAGFAPNTLTEAYAETELLEKYAKLSLQLGRLPAVADMRLETRNGHALPEWSTFTKRFGGKPQLIAKLREHCVVIPEYAQVVSMCDGYRAPPAESSNDSEAEKLQMGFVYLMRSAKYYKIGKATITERRHRDLAIQMPEKLILVHEIKTDDPFGIEAYWHKRFAEKRRNGEWFELNSADIAAFKRRKFM
jgi:hypothetical protein